MGGFLVGIWMVFWGGDGGGGVDMSFDFVVGCSWWIWSFTPTASEKAFLHIAIYIFICSTTNHFDNIIHRPQNPSPTSRKTKKKKNSFQPTPLQSNPPHHRPTFPRNQIHPFTTSPPSAPSSTPSSPPPSSPTPPPSASADPPQTESIHPAYTSQYVYLHH